MSEVAKEDKSYSTEDNLPSKDINFGSSRIVFSHQASAGDKSIDLNNLVTPPDMAANGFLNANPAAIAAAHLSVLRNNLTLLSTRGILTPLLDYTVSDAGTINFLPSSVLGVDGALEGEIFTGFITEVKANAIAVADAKEYDITADDSNFTPGDTVINVGASYRVNENAAHQTGEIRVYKNGKRIYRNVGNAAPGTPGVDGNYHEVDSGNGMGTTIELNVPAQAGDMFGFDFGLKISSGDIQVFEEIERLQGIVLKLAKDAAVDFGTELSDYLTATPSETEKRAFGDLVLKMLSAEIPAARVYQHTYWANSMAAGMLQFSTGNVRFDPTQIFNRDIGIGGSADLMSWADTPNGTEFTFLKHCKVDISIAFPIDDNSSISRINGEISTGGVFSTLWKGDTPRDEQSGGISFQYTFQPGWKFRFNLPIGQIFSTGDTGYMSMFSEEIQPKTTLKQILGL